MNTQREHWGSKLGFILAAAGSAIGLGTLWKFPYVTGANGGGAFILIYILFTLMIGLPLFIAELLIGRASQKSAVPAFTALDHPGTPWKIAGWIGVAASFFIMTFYSVIAGWGMNYILMSLNTFYKDCSPEQINSTFETLSQAGDITLFWTFVFIGITVSVVYRGIREGIEYWSKVITSALLVIVLGLLAYNVTLGGFSKAFDFVFTPDFSKLTTSSVLEALGLALFTLSLGQGVMITYGSYMQNHEDVPKTSLIVSSMVIIVSLLCALTIFPIMFTFDIPPESGFGLVFKTLPVLFSKLPGALLISTTFFTLFVFTALTSSIALVEAVVATLIDLYGVSRKRAALVVGIFICLCSIPCALSFSKGIFADWHLLYGKTYFATIDNLASVWLLPIGGLITTLFVGWKVNSNLLRTQFTSKTSYDWLYGPWYFFIRYIVPVAIITIILQHTGCIHLDSFISK